MSSATPRRSASLRGGSIRAAIPTPLAGRHALEAAEGTAQGGIRVVADTRGDLHQAQVAAAQKNPRAIHTPARQVVEGGIAGNGLERRCEGRAGEAGLASERLHRPPTREIAMNRADRSRETAIPESGQPTHWLLLGDTPRANRLHEEHVSETNNHETRTEAVRGSLEAYELKSRLQQGS